MGNTTCRINSGPGGIEVKLYDLITGQDRYVQPGDMIEFPRGNYNHWAVYVGNGNVIHLWIEGDDKSNNAEVMESKFEVVVQGSPARINNYPDCFGSRPYAADEIVERARRALGKKGYNLLKYNCEHFATECRYGRSWSHQSVGPGLSLGFFQ
ncbi:unnamed protein product [Rotaria sp. Silwood1]|nr:unnamed protein product [Rotaria sp. Silwood1]CAF1670951.1 unnamed protein product [Rotaria sp. Silwood1]